MKGTNPINREQTVNYGTGFILDRRGHVLTCNHVVAPETATFNLDNIKGVIGGQDGKVYPLKVVDRDISNDLLILVLPEGEWEPVASFADGQIGTKVKVFGFPKNCEKIVYDEGVLKGKDEHDRWLTRAGLMPGMSGGPAFDSTGAVVGVISGGDGDAAKLEVLTPIRAASNIMKGVGFLPEIQSSSGRNVISEPGARNANGIYRINRDTDRTISGLVVERIELTGNATIIQMRYTNNGSDLRRIRLYPLNSRFAFRLCSHDRNQSFPLRSMVGVEPDEDLTVASGKCLSFRLQFDRIPSRMVRLDLLEGDGTAMSWRDAYAFSDIVLGVQ